MTANRHPLPSTARFPTLTAGTAVVAAIAASLAAMPLPARAASNEELARQVRAAEAAFAKTMATRDQRAFASHIASDAAFFARDKVLRGKAAIVAGWKPYFEGPKAPFSWEPEHVEVLDSGTLAFSSGPVRDPDGRLIGTFNSVWRRENNGRWKIVFDKGCPPCEGGSPSASGESEGALDTWPADQATPGGRRPSCRRQADRARRWPSRSRIQHRRPALRQAVDLSRENPEALATLGHAQAAAGRVREARGVLGRLQALAGSRYVSPYDIAVLHTGLGKLDGAIKWLERAHADRAAWLIYLNVDLRLDPLRADPRFRALERRVGPAKVGISSLP